jgi:branched-chain amino acid aminotransferase
VDGLEIGSGRRGPITEMLQREFFGLFSGATPDWHGWLDDVGAPALAVAEA